jgi:hypothetical protein
MQLHDIFLSTALGLIIGFFYGLSFVLQRRRVLLYFSTPAPSFNKRFSAFIFAAMRVAFIALVAYYLLPIQSINFILVMLTFLVAFWLVILNEKAPFNEKGH